MEDMTVQWRCDLATPWLEHGLDKPHAPTQSLANKLKECIPSDADIAVASRAKLSGFPVHVGDAVFADEPGVGIRAAIAFHSAFA